MPKINVLFLLAVPLANACTSPAAPPNDVPPDDATTLQRDVMHDRERELATVDIVANDATTHDATTDDLTLIDVASFDVPVIDVAATDAAFNEVADVAFDTTRDVLADVQRDVLRDVFVDANPWCLPSTSASDAAICSDGGLPSCITSGSGCSGCRGPSGELDCDGDNVCDTSILPAITGTTLGLSRPAEATFTAVGNTRCADGCGAAPLGPISTVRGRASRRMVFRMTDGSPCLEGSLQHTLEFLVPEGTYSLMVYSVLWGPTGLASLNRVASLDRVVGASSRSLVVNLARVTTRRPVDYVVEVRHHAGRACTGWTIRARGRSCIQATREVSARTASACYANTARCLWVPDPSYRSIVNGCSGAPSEVIPWLGPCCDQHDVDWENCGMSQQTADDRLESCMLDACRDLSSPSREWCLAWARTGAAAVRINTSRWETTQNLACRCLCE